MPGSGRDSLRLGSAVLALLLVAGCTAVGPGTLLEYPQGNAFDRLDERPHAEGAYWRCLVISGRVPTDEDGRTNLANVTMRVGDLDHVQVPFRFGGPLDLVAGAEARIPPGMAVSQGINRTTSPGHDSYLLDFFVRAESPGRFTLEASLLGQDGPPFPCASREYVVLGH